MRMTRLNLATGRTARRLGWGRNSLRRRSDRVEIAVVLVAICVAFAVVPLALVTGSVVYQQNLAVAAAQNAERFDVTAVLLEDTTSVPAWGGVVSSVPANARWVGQDGSRHSGVVSATQAAAAGTGVPIWTDAHGDLVSAPLTTEQAWGRGVLAAVAAMAVAVAFLVTVVALIRRRLNRVRYAAWEAEWRQIDPWRPHYTN